MTTDAVATPPQIRADRTWEVLCHLAAVLGMCLLAVPIGNIVGPLLIWLIKRGGSTEVDDRGRESLNFQISVSIYVCCIGAVWLVVAGLSLIPLVGIIAWPLAFLMGIVAAVLVTGLLVADIVLVIIAAFKAGEGASYQYPFNLRLIR